MAAVMFSQFAKNQVFDTTELLEMILLEVDPKTLLISGQRVDKRFKQVIDHSVKLQRTLFFKQAPKDGTKYGIQGINPLLIFHSKHRLNYNANTRWFGYEVKYNEYRKTLQRCLNWRLDLDCPRQEAPAVEPSWRRMYVKHGVLDDVHLYLRLEMHNKCFSLWANEPVCLPSEPMVMAEYEAMAEKEAAEWHAAQAREHEAARKLRDASQ